MKKLLVLLCSLTALDATAQEVFLETGFEGSSSLPTGWTQSQISGNATWKVQQGGNTGGNNPASARSGTNNATLYVANTNENKTRLISPVFDTVGYINLTLNFWHTQPFWSPDQDELKVFFSSNGGTNWTQLVHYTANVGNWTQRTINIPSASANTRIAFEGNAKYGYGVSLDDIQVTGVPESLSIVSVTATDATAHEQGQQTGTWTITRTGNTTEAISVNYTLSGNATLGSDYTLNTTSPVHFAAGETSKVVALTPIDDPEPEGNEVATLTLAAGTGYSISNASASITIIDNDPFDLNILVIGSTQSFSDGGESGVVHQKAFDPSGITHHLQNIIAQDAAISDTVNVEFENIFKTKTQTVNTSGSSTDILTSHCYSLAQHYFWPEGKDARLANLRGEGQHQWNYIILTFDPYITANFPGMLAEGVKLIQDEVAKSANPAHIILLAQWPEDSSTFTADQFNEIVYRVGNSASLTVVPAGKAWASYGSKDTNASHPTPRGGYLAASAIYSALYNRSAKTSAYAYPSDGTAIADHALSIVQANDGVAQYTGAYDSAYHPFNMKYVTKRVVSFKHTGTSTELGIRSGLYRLASAQRITFNESGYAGVPGTRWDFNYGRGNDNWEPEKQYKVDPTIYDRSYGFPMLHYNMTNSPLTSPYVIDKHYSGSNYVDATDLGIAYNMIRPGTREPGVPEDVRAIPIRFLWLKMREMSPGLHPLRDSTHYSYNVDDASAAFIYTLLSGRCPVIEEPEQVGSTAWLQWLGHKIGYETAWQMAHLTTRAPGFRVLPSSTASTTVTPTTTQTMTVQFMNPPQADVTVSVSSSNGAAAIVGPATLVFTPENFSTPQNVTLAGIQGAAASASFNVVFETSSDDEVYDGLSDSWAYTCNRSSPQSVSAVDQGTTVITAFKDTPKTLSLNTAGANSANTRFAGPNHGILSWSGADVIYTPNAGFSGLDGFSFAVLHNGVLSSGVIEIDVLDEAAVGTVTYNGNGSDGGTVPFDSNTYTESDVVTVLGNTGGLIKTGHSFSGWNTQSDGSGTDYTAAATFTMGSTGVLLFAQWLPDTYTISYDANEATSGTAPASQPKTFGVELEVSGNTGGLARTGFHFVGWDTAADGSGQSFATGATFTLEQNTTLYARWNAPPVVNAGANQSVALSGSVAWSPTDMTKVAWYDAADISTITQIGGAVSQWNDKSVNGHHMKQSNEANKPVYNSADSLFGGRPSISTGPSYKFLTMDSSIAVKRMYFVTYYGDGTQTTWANHNALVGSPDGSVRLTGRVNGNRVFDGGGDSKNFDINGTTYRNGSTVNTNWQSNGLPINGEIFKVTAPSAKTAQWRLLANSANFTLWNGALGEIIFTDGNEDLATQQRIEGYLAHKWGLDGKLPGDHPHKASAPGGPTAVANLYGTASDPDHDPITTLWSVISGPAGVSFDDPAALQTTATFTAPGTYVLELTSGDGISQTSSQVTVIVSDGSQPTFASWISGFSGLGGLTAFDDDADGDGVKNGIESYFGTHPGEFTTGVLPGAMDSGAGTFTFTHPVNENPTSDITAAYRWTKDLSNFYYSGQSDLDGTTVIFTQGTPADGRVPVTATITGTSANRVFVDIEVTQDP